MGEDENQAICYTLYIFHLRQKCIQLVGHAELIGKNRRHGRKSTKLFELVKH